MTIAKPTGRAVPCFVSKDKKTFCIRKEVTNMPLSRVEKLSKIFGDVSREVFGRRMEKSLFKALLVHHTCKFVVAFKDESYDPIFTSIIIMNIAEASLAISRFNTSEQMPNESRRKARMYFALYMDREKEKMEKIKSEYAEVFKNRRSISGDT